jgi:hypothetical protein
MWFLVLAAYMAWLWLTAIVCCVIISNVANQRRAKRNIYKHRSG